MRNAKGTADILTALSPMLRQMRLQRTAEWAVIGAFVGMAGALLLRAASFLWAFPAVWLWSAAALLGCVLLCSSVSWLWPISPMDAARRVDACGLQARAQTALMLRDSDTPMAELQRQDALNRLLEVRPGQAFPVRAPKAALVGLVACAALLGLSFLLPNPQQSVLAARAAFQEEMKEQARLVDEGAAKLDAEEAQTPELRKLLGDLAMELRKAEEPRKALGAADEAERRITALQNAMKKDAMSALQKSGLSDMAKALEAQDGDLAKQLLTQQEAGNAAEALNAAANAALDAQAASALSAAAQAMLNGNAAMALSQLQLAAGGYTGVTAQAASLCAMVRAAAAGAGMKQASLLAAAGMEGAGGQGGGSAGIGLGLGAGSGAGFGSSNKDGGYREGSNLQPVKGKESAEVKVEAYESVYDPTRLNRSGDAIAAGGKVGEGEVLEAAAGVGVGSIGESVPYNRVLGEYQEAEVQAAQNADLPAYAQKWVTDYFGSLAE